MKNSVFLATLWLLLAAPVLLGAEEPSGDKMDEKDKKVYPEFKGSIDYTFFPFHTSMDYMKRGDDGKLTKDKAAQFRARRMGTGFLGFDITPAKGLVAKVRIKGFDARSVTKDLEKRVKTLEAQGGGTTPTPVADEKSVAGKGVNLGPISLGIHELSFGYDVFKNRNIQLGPWTSAKVTVGYTEFGSSAGAITGYGPEKLSAGTARGLMAGTKLGFLDDKFYFTAASNLDFFGREVGLMVDSSGPDVKKSIFKSPVKVYTYDGYDGMASDDTGEGLMKATPVGGVFAAVGADEYAITDTMKISGELFFVQKMQYVIGASSSLDIEPMDALDVKVGIGYLSELGKAIEMTTESANAVRADTESKLVLDGDKLVLAGAKHAGSLAAKATYKINEDLSVNGALGGAFIYDAGKVKESGKERTAMMMDATLNAGLKYDMVGLNVGAIVEGYPLSLGDGIKEPKSEDTRFYKPKEDSKDYEKKGFTDYMSFDAGVSVEPVKDKLTFSVGYFGGKPMANNAVKETGSSGVYLRAKLKF